MTNDYDAQERQTIQEEGAGEAAEAEGTAILHTMRIAA